MGPCCWGKEILNLAQAFSLPSKHCSAFVFTGTHPHIQLPYKGALTPPCTARRQMPRLVTHCPCQAVSRMPPSRALPHSRSPKAARRPPTPLPPPPSSARGLLQNGGPAGMMSLILKDPFSHIKWDMAGRLKVKMCFCETGKIISWLFKARFGA